MDQKTVRRIAEGLDGEGLTPVQRELIRFSRRLTESPRQFGEADTAALARVLPDPRERLEAVSIAAGFNFANRCADALGVREEVPRFAQRFRPLRWAVMGLFSLVIRARTDFANRPVPEHSADRILSELAAEMAAAGLGSLPPLFERLRPRPDLLDVQALAARTTLIGSGLPRELLLAVVYLVSRLNDDPLWAGEAGRLLAAAGADLGPLDAVAAIAGGPLPAELPPLERAVFGFARDITLHADRTTREQVAELRRLGLADPLILDLIAACAMVNAGNRLQRVLAPDLLRAAAAAEDLAPGPPAVALAS